MGPRYHSWRGPSTARYRSALVRISACLVLASALARLAFGETLPSRPPRLLDLGPARFAAPSADALAFTPDGASLIVFSAATRSAFDSTTGHPLSVAPASPSTPASSPFPLRAQSPDGALTLLQPVGLNPEVREARTGRIVGALPLPWARKGRPDALRLAAFSPRADRVAGVASTGLLAVWSLPDARLLVSLPHREVRALAWSPDGARLAVASRDRFAVLDAASLSPVWHSTHHDSLSALAYSPDGRRVAVGPCRGRIHVYDAESGAEPRDRSILTAAWSPDGRTIHALDESGAVTAWDPGTARERWTSPTAPVSPTACAAPALADRPAPPALACAPDGRVAVSATSMIQVLDAASGVTRVMILAPLPLPDRLAFSPDGRFLACGASSERDAVGEPATIHVLGLKTAPPLRPLTSAAPRLPIFAIDRAGALVAGGRLDTAAPGIELDRWDLETGRPLSPSKPPLDDGPFDISTDSEWLISAREPGALHLLHLARETPLRRELPLDLLPRAVAASDGAARVAVAARDRVLVLDPRTDLPPLSFPLPAAPTWLAFSADGRRLAAVAAGRLVVLDTHTAQHSPAAHRPLPTREMQSPSLHHPGLRALAIAGSPPRIVSAGEDGAVRVWSALTAALELEIPVVGPIASLALAPDARWLAVAQSDTPALYDLETGRLRVRGERAGAPLQRIAVSPDGARVVAALSGGAIAAWNTGGALVARSRPATAPVTLEPPPVAVHVASPDRVLAVREDGRAITMSAELDRVIVEHRWPGPIRSAFHDADRGALIGVTPADEAIALDPTTGVTTRVFWPLHSGRLAPASPSFAPGVAACAAPDATARLERDLRGPRFSLSPDGDHLAVGVGNGQIRVVSLRQGRTLNSIGPDPEPGGRLALSADGRRVATASAVGSWRVWDTSTGRLVRWGAAESVPRHDHDATLALSPDGRVLALGRPGGVRLVDLSAGTCRTLKWPATPSPRAPVSLAFSSSGRQLACLIPPAGFVFEVASGRVSATLAPVAQTIVRARFTRDATSLLGAGPRAACAWEAATGRALWTTADPDRVPGRGLYAALSETHVLRPRGERIEHLDPASGRVVRATPLPRPPPDRAPLEASADGARLVTIDGDRLRVHDAGRDAVLRIPVRPSPYVALSADGATVATRHGYRVFIHHP
jgi:WD40 repeat protein